MVQRIIQPGIAVIAIVHPVKRSIVNLFQDNIRLFLIKTWQIFPSHVFADYISENGQVCHCPHDNRAHERNDEHHTAVKCIGNLPPSHNEHCC